MSSLPGLSPALRPISFAFHGSLEGTKGRQPSLVPRTFLIYLCTKWEKRMERLHIRHKCRTTPSRCDGGCSVLLVLMSLAWERRREASAYLKWISWWLSWCFLENLCQPVWIQSIRGSFLWVDSISLVSIFLGDLESRLCTTSAELNTFVSVLSISSPVTLSTAGVLSIPIVPPPSIWFGSSISNSVNTKTDRQSANCSLNGITSIENLSSRVNGVHAETFRVPR